MTNRTSELSFASRNRTYHLYEMKLFRNREIKNEETWVDVLVDGKSVQEIFNIEGASLTTSENSHFKITDQDELYKQLSGTFVASDLPDSIQPVYVCAECGDYSCGVFGWNVDVGVDVVTWRDFGWYGGIDGEIELLKPNKTLIFNKIEYFKVLSAKGTAA